VELYRDERSGYSYRVPDGSEIETFRALVEVLPGQESPEVYGLHPNADLTFRTLQVQEGLATIVDTMPKGGGGSSGMSREEAVDCIAEDLLSKVRDAYICLPVHPSVCVYMYACRSSGQHIKATTTHHMCGAWQRCRGNRRHC
jgi:hypothetical protein